MVSASLVVSAIAAIIWMAPAVVVVFVGSLRLARDGGDAYERDVFAVDLSAVHV
jgi:hypothetical protein